MSGSLDPLACDHFVHSGEAQSIVVDGNNDGRSWWRSTIARSVLCWFAAWMSIATSQWFAAT